MSDTATDTPAVEVVADERDRDTELKRMLMRRRQIDRTTIVNARDDRRYKLVNSETRAVNWAKSRGFVIVPRARKSRDPYPEHGYWDDAAGAYKVGDLVLMDEPIELYEGTRAENARIQDTQEADKMAGVADQMNRIARNEGRVPAHTDIVLQGDDLLRSKAKRAS